GTKITFGKALGNGVSVHRDAVFGAGLEIRLFPKLGIPGVASFKAGGNLVLFHPALNGVQRPVEIVADALGTATDVATDYLGLAVKPLWKATKHVFQSTVRGVQRLGSWLGLNEAPGPQEPERQASARELTARRLS